MSSLTAVSPDSHETDTAVSLVAVKQIDTSKHGLSLGEKKGLSGITAAGSGAKKSPKLVAFAEVIERLNDLFGDEDFTAAQKESFVETALRVMLDNDVLFTQAAAQQKAVQRETGPEERVPGDGGGQPGRAEQDDRLLFQRQPERRRAHRLHRGGVPRDGEGDRGGRSGQR